MTLEETLALRPSPGVPRPYQFPGFERQVLPGGLQLLTVHVPGRPLVAANLVVRRGVIDEPSSIAGASVLAARSLTEGSERYPGVALIEAAERLGATLHAEASWDAFAASVDVAAPRLRAALELLVELVAHPTFPADEVARLREERLNDLLQIRADPRRRAEDAFHRAVFPPDAPYARPAAGDESTVPNLGPDDLRDVHRSVVTAADAALVVGGDLGGLEVAAMAAEMFGWLGHDSGTVATPAMPSAVERTFVRLVHRPGSVQSEIRIGHRGVPRRAPDFHAIQVMASILGGLFNSRLNMKLREEKGYTYGAGAGFDMRRAAGPFAVRTAVNTDATVPAITETIAELRRIRDAVVTPDELRAARDYLVGVFPLRFETPGAVVGAIGGLFVHRLPDDELARYRSAVEAVTIDDVQSAARDHIDPDRLAVVVVGDADVIGKPLEEAGLGSVEVVIDEPAPDREGAAAEDGAGAAEAGEAG